jgi:hypothetical protein
VEHFGISVVDIERSVCWYQDVLGRHQDSRQTQGSHKGRRGNAKGAGRVGEAVVLCEGSRPRSLPSITAEGTDDFLGLRKKTEVHFRTSIPMGDWCRSDYETMHDTGNSGLRGKVRMARNIGNTCGAMGISYCKKPRGSYSGEELFLDRETYNG